MFRRLRLRITSVAGSPQRVYWYVWWGTLINRLGGVVAPLLMIYLTKTRNLSVPDAGLIVSVFGAGSLVASLVGGQMSDHVGRRSTMVFSLFAGAIAMLMLGFVRDFAAITAMVGIVGFVGELYRPAVLAFVSDIVPSEPAGHRTRAYGMLHWATNLGFAIAAFAGGVFAGENFTILFIVDAATMMAYGVIVLVAVPETRPGNVEKVRERSPVAPARSWVSDGTFTLLLLFVSMLALLISVNAPLSAHMMRQGFTEIAFGVVMAINGLVIIVLQPLIVAFAATRDPSRILAAAALFLGIGVSMHGLASSFGLHAMAVIVWTPGEILLAPTYSAIAASMAPREARGRYQGAVEMAFGTALLIFPALGTWLWEHQGADALWGSCLVLGTGVALGLLATAPARRRRIAELAR